MSIKKVIHKTILLLLVAIMVGCSNSIKHSSAKNALEKQKSAKEEKEIASKNDKTPPIISCTMKSAKFEANKKIDYDRLLLSLSAIDNVDGDVTDSIKQIDSNVEEYTEGTYTITYKASDSAKNESTYNLTVIITSKYSSEDKERLMACFNAYSLIKDRMQSSSQIYIDNLNSNADGSVAVMSYSGDDKYGEYQHGRVVYYSSDNQIYDLQDGVEPSGIKLGEYTYSYDDLEKFIQYYHLEEAK